ncbi:protein TIME FOR COFFEE-like isoform X2 [Tripterygium wilfordii]|uniref:protein TIME FOR COFFEE-like isoform X2 n=1 Tax=Tripterygium wilfordii TaxID=458696 RepID=UPI0018F842EC|nr:protein TIME FOR COFFEE-like isoform X2 [Tripterygium wilfordii]
MDRNREGRRINMAASNGLSRRRHRTISLRDSPEEDGPVELQETARLRDRGSVKKDRDRERDRDRDRERDRDRDRDRLSRSKRRRAERLMHGNNRENGDDESTEESANDEEEEDDDYGSGGGAERVGTSTRLLPPNPSLSSSMANHLYRKSFPLPSKIVKAATTSPWRPTDDMIGATVPRKARSVCAKRSHDWVASVSGVVGEQIHRQASTSPARSNGPNVQAMLSSTTPVSPSSSNASLKKKMPNAPKQRPPKSSSKSASSAQDEIEIEIAEVLYGMNRQPQILSNREVIGNGSVKLDTREVGNSKSTSNAKSSVSSPMSNSPPTALQSNVISAPAHMSVVAPKRKRPRQVKYEDENPSAFTVRSEGPITSTTKVEIDPSEQPAKPEICSHNLEKSFGSAAENGGISHDLMASRAASAQAELPSETLRKPDGNLISDSKPMTEESEIRDLGETKEEPESLKKESPSRLGLDVDPENLKATKANSTVSQIENLREKFQIDLMAPPPLRLSPERDGEFDFVAVDAKAMVTDVETKTKTNGKEDVGTVKSSEGDNAEVEEKAAKMAAEVESQKRVVNKERNIDLQLDLEKSERDSGAAASLSGNKPHQNGQKQQQLLNADKNAQSNSSSLPMSMASWPGGLPPMGYMPPLQGVVSMDRSSVSSTTMQPPHLLFSHPRPKRCATHCYIARNIHYHQQFSRMNPYWPAAAGSALSYGAKACNVGVVPSTESLGNILGRGAAQDKGQGLAIFPGNTGKDKGSPAVNMVVDGAQRKQILLQQALPAGAPSNILHGPAFIFPLSQQQAAAAASVRPGSVKSSPAATGHGASSSTSSTETAAAAAASAISFSYPTIPGNEAQYLAILQNGAYPIPIPAHVGAPPAYRGAHAQAMPFFNGSFYSSQMLHQSSQLQQQQIPATQSHQGQHNQGHPNPSIPSGSSSSQKHLQNQQQVHSSSGINGNLLGFPGQKNQTSQSLQPQQRHQPQGQIVSHQTRQLESEAVSEDSPSTGDSRVSRANVSIYGQSFTMPFPPPNFALMNPAAVSTATGTNGNHIEKKQQPQQQGSKAGVESLPSPAFAMSFASMNGGATASGLDISSLAQNHALRQSLPESTRLGYHVTAAAQAAQHKKNYHASEEGKTSGSDALNMDEERRAMAGKVHATVGQSIGYFRSDATGNLVSTIPGSTVVDSSARTVNLGSASGRASNSIMSTAVSTVDSSRAQQQLHYQSFQHQHLMMVHRLQQQAQAAAVAARSKTPATSNGSIYPDQVTSSSSITAKFPNSAFPQSLVQSSSSPGQSSQWKNSVRAASQVPSPTTASSTSSSLKNITQHQGRSQQSQTQISFATNPKTSTAGQVQLPSVSNQSPSPPMVVGSPTTSISKSAGGSPRTTVSTSTGNKGGQASALSSQPAKSSQSLPSHKSSPVSGRSVPSILGNPHISSASMGTKSQLPQQQQLLQKHAMQQQAQIPFSSAYIQVQGQHAANTTNATSASSGYYLQRHRNEQQQQLQSSSATSSSGMLSLCPPVTSNTSTSDPTKAIAAAAAASNMKGGILTSQGLMHAPYSATQSSAKPHQLVPTSFSYVHPVPTPVQVKPAEQKQPAGE